MAKLFIVDGYWKDYNVIFNDYLITETDEIPSGYSDSRIFYAGLTEEDIMRSTFDDENEFVITDYNIVLEY